MTWTDGTAIAQLVITSATGLVVIGRYYGRTEKAAETPMTERIAANGQPTTGELARRIRQLEDDRREDRTTYVHRSAWETRVETHEREHDEIMAALNSLRAADQALAQRLDSFIGGKR